MTTPQPNPLLTWTPPPFTPIKFIPASEEPSIRSAPITTLYAVAHARASHHSTSTLETNHWAFYIHSQSQSQSPDASSTTTTTTYRLDCIPSGIPGPRHGGSKANILISRLPPPAQNGPITDPDAVRECRINLTSTITIDWLLTAVVAAKREKYEFSAEGTGCRNWVVDQLGLWGDVLDEGDRREAERDVQKLWPEGTVSELCGGAGYYA